MPMLRDTVASQPASNEPATGSLSGGGAAARILHLSSSLRGDRAMGAGEGEGRVAKGEGKN